MGSLEDKSSRCPFLGQFRNSSKEPNHCFRTCSFSSTFPAFANAFSNVFRGLLGGSCSFYVLQTTSSLELWSTNENASTVDISALPDDVCLQTVLVNCNDLIKDDEWETLSDCICKASSGKFLGACSAFQRFSSISSSLVIFHSLRKFAIAWDSSLFDERICNYFFRTLTAELSGGSPILSHAIRNVNETTEEDISVLQSQPYRNYLHGLFYHNVVDFPNQTAFTFCKEFYDDEHFSDVSFTFGQFHCAAMKLASQIQTQHSVVPVLVPHSPELFVSILAILYSGNAYCPIDIESTEDRVSFICKDVEASYILTTSQYKTVIPHTLTKIDVNNSLISERLNVDAFLDKAPSFEATTNETSYVLYTSGSTGTPKGVPISHDACTKAILSHTFLYDKYRLSRGDRWLQFANLTFDVSVFEIFGNWNMGLELVTAARDSLVGSLEYLIRHYKANGLELTPTVANVISVEENRGLLSSVRMLVSIGELLTERVIDFWDTRLVNAYGPTETAIHVTLNPSVSQTSVYLVGTPLQTAELYILNVNQASCNEILAEGYLGEICVAGPQLSRGYLHRDDLNEKVFAKLLLDNSSAAIPIYRTGDSGRIIDGQLYVYGRIQGDLQVKIRGRRVELGEIESKLTKSAKSLVVEKIDQSLAAFFVGNKQEVERTAHDSLPAWMRPSAFIQLLELPRLSSGKADRKKLKADFNTLLKSQTKPDNNFDYSLSDEGKALLQAIHVVLSRKRQDITDALIASSNILDLGMDSLDAVQVIRILGTKGFVCGMAKLMTETFSDVSASLRYISPPLRIKQKLPDWICSDLQIGMLYDSLKDDRKLFVNQAVIKIDYSAAEVVNIWPSLLKIHDLLNFGFKIDEKNHFIKERTQPKLAPTIEHVSKSYDIRRHLEEVSVSEEFLLNGPYDAKLFVFANDCTYLSVVIHHALYDGWSIDILMNNIEKLLGGKTPKVASSYDLFLNATHDYRVMHQNNDEAFWKRVLNDYKQTCSLPKTTQYTELCTKNGLKVSSVEAFCQRWRVTPNALFHAAWSIILAKTLKSDDLVVGTVVSERSFSILPDVDYVFGPCMATLPLRTSVKSGLQFFKHCQLVNYCLANTIEHSSLSFHQIKACTQYTGNLDTVLILQKTSIGVSHPHVVLRHMTDYTEHGILLSIDIEGNGDFYSFSMTSLLEENLTSELLTSFETQVKVMIEKPNETLSLPNVNHSLNSIDKLYTEQDTIPQNRWSLLAKRYLENLLSTDLTTYSYTKPLIYAGFDSFMALRLLSILKKDGFKTLKLTDLKDSSVESISSALETNSGKQQTSEEHTKIIISPRDITWPQKITSNDVEAFYYCTPVQQALITSTLTEGIEHYYNYFLFDIKIGVQQFVDAFTRLCQETPILRTCFAYCDSEKSSFCQLVLKTLKIEPRYEEYKEGTLSQYTTSKLDLLTSGKPPMDLIILNSDTACLVLLVMHHTLYDAESFNLILERLNDLIAGDTLRKADNMELFVSHIYECQHNYNLEDLVLPLRNYHSKTFPELSFDHGESVRQCRQLGASLDDIKQFCSDAGVSISSLLLTIWATCLSILQDTVDVCFGSVVNERHESLHNTDEVLGPTFNTVPIRVEFDKQVSFIRHCQKVEKQRVLFNPLRYFSTRQIKQALGLGRGRLFDTVFILQSQGVFTSEYWNLINESSENDFAVMLEAVANEESKTVNLTVSTWGDKSSNDYLISLFDYLLLSSLKMKTHKLSELTFPDGFYEKREAKAKTEPMDTTIPTFLKRPTMTKGGNTAVVFLSLGETLRYSFLDIAMLVTKAVCYYQKTGIKTGSRILARLPICPELLIIALSSMFLGINCYFLDVGIDDNHIDEYVSLVSPDLTFSEKADFNSALASAVPDLNNIKDFKSSDELKASAKSVFFNFLSKYEQSFEAVSVTDLFDSLTFVNSHLQITENDRCFHLQSILTGAKLSELLLAYTAGATSVILDFETSLNDLTLSLKKLNITILSSSLSLLYPLNDDNCECLRAVICQGPSPRQVNKKLKSKLFSFYAPKRLLYVALFDKHPANSAILRHFAPTVACSIRSFDDTSTVKLVGVPGVMAIEFGSGSCFITEDVFKMSCDGKLRFEASNVYSYSKSCGEMYLDKIANEVMDSLPTLELLLIIPSWNDEPINLYIIYLLRHEQDGTNERIEKTTRKLLAENLEAHLCIRRLKNATEFISSYEEICNNVSKKSFPRTSLNAEDGSYDSQNDILDADLLKLLQKVGHHKGEIHSSTQLLSLGIDSLNTVRLAFKLQKMYSTSITASAILNCDTVDDLQKLIKETHPVNTERVDELRQLTRKLSEAIKQHIDLGTLDIKSIVPCVQSQVEMLTSFFSSNGEKYLNYITYELSEEVDLDKLYYSWNCITQKLDILKTIFVPTFQLEHPYAQVVLKQVHTQWKLLNVGESLSESLRCAIAEVKESLLKSRLSLPYRVIVAKRGQQPATFTLLLHHAMFDATSLENLLMKVKDCYYGELLQDEYKYEDVVAQIYSMSKLKKAKQFWVTAANGFDATLFPNLNATIPSNSEVKKITKKSSLSLHMLKQYTKKFECSLLSLVQLAWAKILSSYTGEQSVVFGSVLSGHNALKDSESSFFPCLTTSPVFVSLNGLVKNCVRRLNEFNKASVTYQYTSLRKVKEWLGFRSTSMLFNTLFICHVPSLNHNDIFLRERTSYANLDYPLTFEIELTESYVLFSSVYNTSIIPESHALLLLNQYEALLNVLLSSPEGKISELEKLLDYKLLSVIKPTVDVYPSSAKLLHQMFEVSATSFPNAVALEFVTDITTSGYESKCYTYDKVNRLANQIARYILKKKGSSTAVITVCFEKCPEAFITILGVLKSGSAFLALDPSAPIERKQFIVKDSASSLVFASGETYECLKNENLSAELVDASNIALFSSFDECNCAVTATEQDLSYILYTSGSTGKPKGCCLTHQNAVQAILAFQEQLSGSIDENARCLAFASFHFDVSVLEQYYSWSTGITLVSAHKQLLLRDLPHAVQCLKITHIDLTPSLASILTPENSPFLRVFITGGERLRQEVLDIWGNTGVLYNFWGPTELTIGASAFRRLPRNARVSNIGPPFPNCGAFVLSPETNTPVLFGGIGEICMSGAQVFKGYLNLPAATDNRIIQLKPFSDRVYKTGDLGRFLKDNCSIDFFGRVDNQIKLRGQRIEIDEINTIVKESSDRVIDAVTLVARHPSHNKDQLITFLFLGKPKSDVSFFSFLGKNSEIINHIKKECQTKLANYMVPSLFFVVKELPLTPTNKLDVKRLLQEYAALDQKSLNFAYRQANSSFKQSKTSQHQLDHNVAALIASFTKIPISDISPDMSIYELGLDSVSVVLLSSLFQKHGYSLATPLQLQSDNYLYRISENLTASHGPSHPAQKMNRIQVDCSPGIKKLISIGLFNKVERITPCLPLVEGILFEFEKSKRGTYWTGVNLSFPNEQLKRKFLNLFNQTYKSYEVLRSSFIQIDGVYYQVFWKGNAISTVSRNLENEFIVYKPFELITKQKVNITLRIFHGVFDGWSLNLLLHDYDRLLNGDTPIERPSYSKTVETILSSVDEQSSRQFYSKYSSPLILPRLELESQEGIAYSQTLHVSFLKLETVRRKVLQCSQQVFFLASWAFFINSLSTCSSFGLIIGGRTGFDDSRLKVPGPLFNTVCFMVPDAKDIAFSDFVKRCQEHLTLLSTHQYVALKNVKKWLRTGTLFNMLFSFLDKSSDPEFKSFKVKTDSGRIDVPFAVEIERLQRSRYRIHLTSKYLRFNGHKIVDIINEYEAFLSRILVNPLLIMDSPEPIVASTTNTSKSGTQIDSSPLLRKIIQLLDVRYSVPSEAFFNSSTIYEFGMDSIDLIWLSSQLSSNGIGKLDIAKFVEDPKFGNLLNCITSDSQVFTTKAVNAYSKLKNSNEFATLQKTYELVYPATYLQAGILLESLQEQSSYMNSALFSLMKGVNLYQLKKAWLSLISSNPIFCTKFYILQKPVEQIRVLQTIVSSTDDLVHLIKGISSDEVLSFYGKLRSRSIQELKPLDVVPFQVWIIETNKQSYMSVHIHHVLYDGWSLSLMYQELSNRYMNIEVQKRLPYSNYIEATYNKCLNASMWQSFFENLTMPKTVFSVSSNELKKDEFVSVVDISKITFFAKSQGVSPQTLFYYIWGHFLSKYKGEDPVFHTIMSGRTQTNGAETVMGLCMNTLPLRVFFKNSLHDSLLALQHLYNCVSANSFTPLTYIHTYCQQLRDVEVDTLFICQHSPLERSEISPPWKLLQEDSKINYPLAVEVDISDNHLYWRSTSRTNDLFRFDLLQHLDSLLLKLVQGDLELPVFSPENTFTNKGIKFVTNDVRSLVLSTFNNVKECFFNVIHDDVVNTECLVFYICFSEKLYNAGEISEKLTKLINEFSKTVRLSFPQGLIPDIIIPFDDNLTKQMKDSKFRECFYHQITPLKRHQLASLTRPKDSPVQGQIIKILSETTGIQENDIKPSSSIFELGLDSVSAIKISAQMRHSGFDVSVADIVKHPSAERLASFLTERTMLQSHNAEAANLNNFKFDIQRVAQLLDVDEREIQKVLPVSAGQLFALSSWLATNKREFCSIFVYDLINIDDFGQLKHAWKELVETTDILRTSFLRPESSNDNVLQVVLNTSKTNNLVELAFASKSQFLDYLKSFDINMTLKTPFKPFLCKTNDNLFLAFYIHHALYDAWSLFLLIQKLLDLYNRRETRTSGSAQGEFLSLISDSSMQKEQQAYWNNYLKGSVSARFNSQTDKKERVKLFCEHVTSISAVKARCIKLNVSFPSYCFATFAKVMSTYLRQKDFTFGIYVSGRNVNVKNIENTIFPTFNVIPLRFTNTDDSISQMAKTAHEFLISTNGVLQQMPLTHLPIAGLLNVTMNFLATPDGGEEDATGAIVKHVESIRPSIKSSTTSLNDMIKPLNISPQLDFEVKLDGEYLNLGLFCHPGVLDSKQAKCFIEGFVCTLHSEV
ncbi:ferrichrome synthetase Sib1 [Schizosaccharomyces japonicus yFS275]|uniref:Ferrichrome synthetase Sib1 n=1 Tax=Schizosaccharomyces japonicus (strain yFS275 / FY16936) TaxID=402676 RepID=B6K5Q6_SCHJY|nr:ferrichrome synthetase Sib1 [Schizosaccharomyces japonicus yFS275]EEB08860.1 ferrichrome synthetase Sib1 [Schizosaccharomyces japonicus yFS275]